MVGPLSEVEPRMKQLASNLFTSLMMMESMERLEIAEEEYELQNNEILKANEKSRNRTFDKDTVEFNRTLFA